MPSGAEAAASPLNHDRDDRPVPLPKAGCILGFTSGNQPGVHEFTSLEPKSVFEKQQFWPIF
jgi:hypothetical protein